MPTILSEAPVNKSKLIAWLTERSSVKSPVVGAIYSALADRIARGDFDSSEFDGYFIAASDLSEKSTSSLWDGEVHLSQEKATDSIDAIVNRPDWYANETRSDWAVYGLVKVTD